MEYKRYIFLDVDGVLNHPEFYESRRLVGGHLSSHVTHLSSHVDPKCIKLLNQLEGCEVVMITSWSHEECMEVLPKLGLKLPVIGGVKARELAYQWIVRGNSIAEWFVDNYGSMPRDSFFDSFEPDGWWHPGRNWDFEKGEFRLVKESKFGISYVIFDDNADMLMDQKNHFIHINPHTGITQEDINKAKQILNL